MQSTASMPPGVNLFLRLKRGKQTFLSRKIREQLKMRRGLRYVLAYAKEHPEDPVQKRRKNATFFRKLK